MLISKETKRAIGLTSQSVAVARAPATKVHSPSYYLTAWLSKLREPLSGRVTARAAKPAAEWFLRAKRGTLRVGDCVYTAPGPSGGTAGVPEVRADSVQGLAGRGRGYPRISSGSDTFGDTHHRHGRDLACPRCDHHSSSSFAIENNWVRPHPPKRPPKIGIWIEKFRCQNSNLNLPTIKKRFLWLFIS